MKFDELHKRCAKYRDDHITCTSFYAVLNQLQRVCFENGDVLPNVFCIHTINKDLDIKSILNDILKNYSIYVVSQCGGFIEYEIHFDYKLC